MFRPLTGSIKTPSEELLHFTNRVSEKAAFQRLLDLPSGELLPVLMFYGVGGTGKSWLLKRLQRQANKLPTAYLDLDPRSGGTSYHVAWAKALAEIRRQLGPKVKCPRFDLAYTWLRFKEGASDEPHFRGTGFLAHSWDLIVEAGSAAANGIPGISLVAWAIRKITTPVVKKLNESGLEDWLALESGQIDFLKLKSQQANDIYPELHIRLLQDLRENLPSTDHSARAVVFIDTIETLHSARDSESRQMDNQQWLRDLYHPESGLLVVLAGRDQLRWGHDPQSDFAKPEHLEQHLVGGLSEPDAREFLSNCGFTDAALQSAILHVSEDRETQSLSASSGDETSLTTEERSGTTPEAAYHPFSLGLCVDTCHNLHQQNLPIDPATFDMLPDDTRKLADRFLRSLGGDGTYAQWLNSLAITPQFDETAARAAFSITPGAEQDAAWKTLLSYSFVRTSSTPGWYTLHLRMRDALEEQLQSHSTQDWTTRQQFWQTHWSNRSQSTLDSFAATAWYHSWQLDPESARLEWKKSIEHEYLKCRMANHYSLLSWWLPCRLEERLNGTQRLPEAAAAVKDVGVEFRKATQGDRSANLKQAIECFQAALRIYTESEFPYDWAMTQNDLGIAYRDLPTGDREENLRLAIECYQAALLIRTKSKFPQQWAMTQNNLGVAYRDLPTGDHGENLCRAIECYQAALRTDTESEVPQQWAMTQNNLGVAYCELPTGDHGENLRQAIKCYQAALRIYTESEFPQDWAMTQNNLGNTYSDLPIGDRGENLRRAIECYQAALRIYTESEFPQQWAITQNNLGATYRYLPTGDRGENLRLAIECYQAALRIRTESEFPQGWAETTANIAFAEWTAASEWSTDWRRFGWSRDTLRSQAEERLIRSTAVFESIGHDHHAERLRQFLADLGCDLDSDASRQPSRSLYVRYS